MLSSVSEMPSCNKYLIASSFCGVFRIPLMKSFLTEGEHCSKTLMNDLPFLSSVIALSIVVILPKLLIFSHFYVKIRYTER